MGSCKCLNFTEEKATEKKHRYNNLQNNLQLLPLPQYCDEEMEMNIRTHGICRPCVAPPIICVAVCTSIYLSPSCRHVLGSAQNGCRYNSLSQLQIRLAVIARQENEEEVGRRQMHSSQQKQYAQRQSRRILSRNISIRIGMRENSIRTETTLYYSIQLPAAQSTITILQLFLSSKWDFKIITLISKVKRWESQTCVDIIALLFYKMLGSNGIISMAENTVTLHFVPISTRLRP